MKKHTIIFMALFVFAAFLATAVAQETKVVTLDVKYDPTTFVHRGDHVIMAVNIYLMQKLDPKQEYIPVEVAVGNADSSKLTLTRDGFTLVDEAGETYDAVSAREIGQNYKRLNFDHERAQIPHIMGPLFAGYRPVAARFTPNAKPGSLVYETIDLSANDALVDILYFKMPAAKVKGKSFELRLTAPNLVEPISVKFKVD